MSDSRTKVVLKAKDGRVFEKIFDTYEEACTWVYMNTSKHGISLELEMVDFDQDPSIEIYKQKL